MTLPNDACLDFSTSKGPFATTVPLLTKRQVSISDLPPEDKCCSLFDSLTGLSVCRRELLAIQGLVHVSHCCLEKGLDTT